MSVLRVRERSLEQTNKELSTTNKTKDKFFSIIAHNLHHPIISMSDISNLFESDFKELSSEEINRYIKELVLSSSHLVKLLNNLQQ